MQWIGNGCWAILVLILLWTIEYQLAQHRAYISKRDVVWEKFDKRVEANQKLILDSIQRNALH
jgi:hypothetical protein